MLEFMSELEVVPQALTGAAENLDRLGTLLTEANATGIAPAAADEISAQISAVFNGQGAAYQEIASTAQAIHAQFSQALAQAGQAYQNAEWTSAQTLWNTVALPANGAGPVPLPSAPPGQPVALLVGGTGYPVLGGSLANVEHTLYFPHIGSYGPLYTPEQLWPYGQMTLGKSVYVGTGLLNQGVMTELGTGNPTTVWTTSQSSILGTNEIRNLMAQGSPYSKQLSFILTGNPNNPNGGIFERFTGGYIPGLDVLANGATPPNSPYHVQIYTNQYDAVGDFPEYPLNPVSDANALAGFFLGAHDYSPLPGTPMLLPTSPGYTGNTQYYFETMQNLPLVEPLRAIPYAGYAGADLLQPDLRVLSDLGYGQGEYPNIPTPARLMEHPNWPVVGHDLWLGAGQGVRAAGVDLGLLPQSDYPMGHYPFSPMLNPGLNYPQPQTGETGLSHLTTFEGQLARTLGLMPPWDQ